MTAADAQKQMKSIASAELAASAARFFKTGPGQYGEGDTFIGIKVPTLRKLARDFHELPLSEVETLLRSPIHEERLLALLVLVLLVNKAGEAQRKAVRPPAMRQVIPHKSTVQMALNMPYRPRSPFLD